MHTILPHDTNPALRALARDVPLAEISSMHIQTLIHDMKALLPKEEYGVALAAPQVGESLRLFIISGSAVKRREKKYHDADAQDAPPIEDAVYINPTLMKISRKKLERHEGCLSIRGRWGIVPRAEKATIHAWNEKGEEFTRGASGLLAHIFQHEMDHLEGIMYTDKATELYDDKPEDE
ncbi:peptide deformylase [Candidatus Kaiserbacteria bacterium]|nr:peptide deformylase [Candidatus Kaiserbacteria bacterium]